MSAQMSADVLVVILPSPAGRDVLRDYAGGFGVALPSPRTSAGHGGTRVPHLPAIYAASELRRRGRSVAFIDAQAEDLSLRVLADRVAAAEPRAILASVSLPSMRFDLGVLAELKRRTNAAIAVSGTVCRADETLADVLANDAVDIAVTGDPEVVAVPLADRLLSGDAVDVPGTAVRVRGRVKRIAGGEISDLDALPIPAFSMLPMEHYRSWEFGRSRSALGKQFGPWPRVFALYWSRGCPHACSYCPYPLGVGRRWRRKSVERVVQEFEALSRAGTHHVVLRDQTIGENTRYVEAVCEALAKARTGVTWLCEARLGSLGPETLRLMRAAGCVRIHYGVETGDPDLFAAEAKRGIEPREVDRALRETREAQIMPSLHFLVGLPGETWRSIERTIGLIDRCGVKGGDCSIMTPYPGTPYYERMRRTGDLADKPWEAFTGHDPVSASGELSPVELVTARWRILAAIEANSRPGLRRRVRAARSALAGESPYSVVATRLDEAIEIAAEKRLVDSLSAGDSA